MKKAIFKILLRLIIVIVLICLLMHESDSDISFLYANF